MTARSSSAARLRTCAAARNIPIRRNCWRPCRACNSDNSDDRDAVVADNWITPRGAAALGPAAHHLAPYAAGSYPPRGRCKFRRVARRDVRAARRIRLREIDDGVVADAAAATAGGGPYRR